MGNCYIYEYISNTSNSINLNGTLCEGGSYSITVPGFGEGTTSCLQELSQGTIDSYFAIGLTLTPAATTCGTFGETPTPTVTRTQTPTPSVTPPVTPSPTAAVTPTGTPTQTPTPSTTQILYYTLNSCEVGDPLYDTTITPVLTNQKYVDPVSGHYWVWDNLAGTSSPQQTVNASLQIVSGQVGCGTGPFPLPATGTEISIGKVYNAFGLVPGPAQPGISLNIALNATLGVNRQPPYANSTAIALSAQTALSLDFGGISGQTGYVS